MTENEVNTINDISFSEMQEIQKELQEKYYKEWGGLSPEKAKNQLLYMMIEAGEAADVIKKTPTAKYFPKKRSESILSRKCAMS